MRGAEVPDDTAGRRLAALGLGPSAAPVEDGPVVGRPVVGGWVPEQPDRAVAVAQRADLRVPSTSGAASLAAVRDRLPVWAPPWLRSAVAAPSGNAVLVLLLVCVACVGITAFTLLHRPAVTPAADYPPAPALPAVALPSPTPVGIVVDVGGRVRHPGLVTLSPGARVADALRAAGGALRRADLRLVDLAARVSDGQLLLVGISGVGPTGAAGTTGASGADAGPVNLNTATVDQLDGLPGIGPVLAQRILDWRSAHNGFHRLEDLKQVSGIGDATYADLAPLVAV
jgi:competence protein ComEA